MTLRWREYLHLQRRADGDVPVAPAGETAARLDELQEERLSSVFAPPRWLRDLGRAAWLLVGAVALLVGVVWLLAETAVIVGPVIVGLVVATVASPIVSALERHRFPRTAGAFVVLLGLVALAGVILLLVLGGLYAQSDEIAAYASSAADKAQSWVADTGVGDTTAEGARADVESAVSGALSTLVHGLAQGISGLASLAFGISFTVFSLFFLLRDGPALRSWIERHLGVPAPVAHAITGNVVTSMRRYFTGVTIVAAFNGVVVGIGAIALGVPLAGTIAVVTFVTAYVPFIGAFVSGAFAVVLALADGGTSTALVMLVIVLLANGLLQNVVQPIAFGATLKLNPLLVLVVTISAGSLFGMIGLVLAAPLLSAAVGIVRDVGRIRGAAGRPPAATALEAPPPVTV